MYRRRNYLVKKIYSNINSNNKEGDIGEKNYCYNADLNLENKIMKDFIIIIK